jgi:hypothetical protein
MQKQQGRPLATHTGVQAHTIALDRLDRDLLEHGASISAK